MFHRSFLLLLICYFCSYASEDFDQQLPMSDIEGGSICMVEGVNVITGNYSFFMDPLVVPGPQPVSFQIGYIADLLWRNNFDTKLYFSPQFSYGYFFQFGSGAYFDQTDDQEYSYKIKMSHGSNKGLTNIGQGEISAKTSHRNILVNLPDQSKSGFASFTTGSGEKKSFKRIRENTAQCEFQLVREFKPNGTQVFYGGLCQKPNSLPQRFKIRSADAHNRINFASVQVKSFRGKNPKVIEASDGREVRIEYISLKDNLLPKGINHPHLPYYNFEYLVDHFEKPLLFKIFKGKGRQTELSYYGQGKKPKKKEKDFLRGKVKKISKVIGGGLDNCDQYHFEYKINDEKNRQIYRGNTIVTDALGYRRNFVYGDNLKITSITHSASENTFLKIEAFAWSQERLVRKELRNRAGSLFMHHYTYDDSGNVIREDLKGRFSGCGDALETCFKEYTYSNDKFNNMLSAADDDTTTVFVYKNNTDLCSKELVTDNGNILRRKFMEYDNYSTLTKEIADDSSSEKEDDFTGMTHRIIKYYTPKKSAPCIGYPIEIKEVYFDFETKKEKQIKRLVNDYTREGWLTKQEVYDADDNYCYTLEWEYNRFGKVTKELDPLGHVITRDYDIYGNIIREEGSKLGQITLYKYNFLNQPIRKEIRNEGSNSFVETYKYNQMGYRTLSRNIFGEGKVDKYDSYGRNIETVLPNALGENGLQPISVKRQFDCLGNVTQVTDPLGRETKKTYNILGKPTSITYPDGTSEQWIYNLNGTLKTHKDKKGTETHFEWDCLKRLIGKTVISSDGEVLSKEIKTYKGSLLVSETDAAGTKTNYSYDGAGRKIAAEREGRLTTYEYDSLGRESVVKQWHDGNWIASVKIYDFCNQIIDEYREDSSGRIWGRVQIEYDETGNKISEIVHTDEGLSITKTEYNVLNQPTKIIDPLGYATYIDYNFEFRNEFEQRVLQKTTVDPKGIQTVETYDVFDRVIRVEKKDPFGQMLSKVDRRFDFVGNLIQEEQTVIAPGKDDRTITNLMEYNSADQLTCLIEAAGSNDQRVTRYEYNDFGEKEKILKPNGIVLKYTYNALGLVEKLESLNAPEESAICYEYTYDNLKNLISVVDRINNFETERRYNDHSEMIFEKLGNDLEIFYEKDYLGRTVKTTFPCQKEVGYLYQGDHLLQAVYKTSQDEYYANYRYGLSGKLKRIHQIGLAGRIGISYDLMGRETCRDSKYWYQNNIIYDETGNLISRDVTDQWGLNHCEYSYDKLDQLVSEEGMATHSYTHDSMNNRIVYDGGEIAINDLNQVLTANGKTYAYDLAGNLILDNDSSYLYDALDRLITVVKNEEKYRYIYDSQNRRIAKQKYCKTTSRLES